MHFPMVVMYRRARHYRRRRGEIECSRMRNEKVRGVCREVAVIKAALHPELLNLPSRQAIPGSPPLVQKKIYSSRLGTAWSCPNSEFMTRSGPLQQKQYKEPSIAHASESATMSHPLVSAPPVRSAREETYCVGCLPCAASQGAFSVCAKEKMFRAPGHT